MDAETKVNIIFGLIVFFIAISYPLSLILMEGYSSVKRSVKIMLAQNTQRKQEDCFHIWRRLDAEYRKGYTMYRYRCEKCKLDKIIDSENKEKFERDFLVDHYGDI